MRSFVLALLVCGCSPPPDPATNRLADVEVGVRALNRAVGVTTAFVGTAVIDPGMTPGTITNALALYFKANTNDCGTATAGGTSLDADLSKGCTLGTAMMLVKGTVHADLVKNGNRVSITFFPNLTVDGSETLTGNIRVDTSGSVADIIYKSDLAMSSVHVTSVAEHAGLGGSSTIIQTTGTLDGPTVTGGKITANSLQQRFSGCYPDDGSLQLTTAGSDETFNFDGSTPGTGETHVGVDNKVVKLPPRDGCPRM